MSVEIKICDECGVKITGRIDKRFCSDHCRSAANNRKHMEDQDVRAINRILRRNRRVLMDLNPEGKCKVSREKMHARGFDFQYFTSIYRTREGTQYYYCYDQGYLPLDNGWLLLVVRKNK